MLLASAFVGKWLRLIHGIIFEPDLAWRPLLESALAGLYWTVAVADSLEDVADLLPSAWAAILAVESGDLDALETIRELRNGAPAAALCVLVDELSPDFDGQLRIAGVDAVFAKPVQEEEIVEALVAGFWARRG